jgi:hypothetical protein
MEGQAGQDLADEAQEAVFDKILSMIHTEGQAGRQEGEQKDRHSETDGGTETERPRHRKGRNDRETERQ